MSPCSDHTIAMTTCINSLVVCHCIKNYFSISCKKVQDSARMNAASPHASMLHHCNSIGWTLMQKVQDDADLSMVVAAAAKWSKCNCNHPIPIVPEVDIPLQLINVSWSRKASMVSFGDWHLDWYYSQSFSILYGCQKGTHVLDLYLPASSPTNAIMAASFSVGFVCNTLMIPFWIVCTWMQWMQLFIDASASWHLSSDSRMGSSCSKHHQ